MHLGTKYGILQATETLTGHGSVNRSQPKAD